MRWIAGLVAVALWAGSGVAAMAQAAGAKPAPPKVKAAAPTDALPDAFDGWEMAGAAKPIADATQADPASASALKEYGLTGGSSAEYKRNGQTLTLRVLRFPDASGEFGAYSFYRQNNWPREEIGAGASSFHNRVLFWKGNTLVDATFAQVNASSGSALRELAKAIPAVDGSKGSLPPILANLPKSDLDGQTTHYALGAAGYAGAGGVLPASVVAFDNGAEAVTASYKLSSGPATLTLIDYPTPQMAEAMEGRIRAYIQAGSQAQPAWTKPLLDSDRASLEVRRSGPLVILVSGDAIPKESHKLLELVHFEADVTNLPSVGGDSEVSKTGKLLMGIAALVIVGGGAALLLGFFLGGGRALYRIARGKPASSVFDEDFIRIDFAAARQDAREPAKDPDLKG